MWKSSWISIQEWDKWWVYNYTVKSRRLTSFTLTIWYFSNIYAVFYVFLPRYTSFSVLVCFQISASDANSISFFFFFCELPTRIFFCYQGKLFFATIVVPNNEDDKVRCVLIVLNSNHWTTLKIFPCSLIVSFFSSPNHLPETDLNFLEFVILPFSHIHLHCFHCRH